MRQYCKIVLRAGSAAGLEVTSWMWQHPRVSSAIASFKYELEKKRNLRPLKKPVFSEELLVDGSWWRKDFDFCSFISHLNFMSVQKSSFSWRNGNMWGHCSPYSHFTFPVSMSHFGCHSQTTPWSKVDFGHFSSVLLAWPCGYLWLWSTMKFTLILI